jgi:transposase-like protein
MKYTPEKAKEIVDLIRDGNYNITAALCCGISESTFYKWIEDHPEFSESIKQARAESERDAVKNIKKAAKDTWQAEAWFLERTNYRKWGKVDTHNVVNKNLSDFMEKLSDYRESDEETEKSS